MVVRLCYGEIVAASKQFARLYSIGQGQGEPRAGAMSPRGTYGHFGKGQPVEVLDQKHG